MAIRTSRRTAIVIRVLIGIGAAIPWHGATAQALEPAQTVPMYPSPLKVRPHQPRDLPAVALQLDEAARARLSGRQHMTLSNFVLAPAVAGDDPETVTLALQRLHVLAPDVQFVDGSFSGKASAGRPRRVPDVMLFGGTIQGRADSRVFLSFSPRATYGYLEFDDRLQIISSGPSREDRDVLIYDINSLPAGAIHWRDFICDAQQAPDRDAVIERVPAAMGGPPCRKVRVAIETDWQFAARFWDLDEASAYVITLIGASSQIYTNQMNVQLELGFVRLWSTPDDPWDATTAYSQLTQFRTVWNSTMQSVPRHIAHFLSCRNLGGGYAWLNVVCGSSYGYAISANLNGYFPYPLQHNNSQNWDINVVTHEIGHNFGTSHTHNYCPPLDSCAPPQYWGACQTQTQCLNNGTIMSYCHVCPGGMANIVLQFHPANIDTMLSAFAAIPSSQCWLSCSPPPAVVHVPADFPTIQQAIQVVANYGEIVVAPGVYNQQIDFLNKPIAVRSSGGPLVTTIQSPGTVVQMNGAQSAVLDGFTITGGSVSGIRCTNTSSATIVNCIIRNNSAASSSGGGVRICCGGHATLVDCLVQNNFVGNPGNQDGGGIAVTGAGTVANLLNGVVQNNNAFWGGGVSVTFGASATIARSRLQGNAGSAGGALYVQDATAAAVNCLFLQNSSSGGAAARAVDSVDPNPTLLGATNCTMTLHTGSFAVWNLGASVALRNCIMRDNSAGITASGAHTTTIAYSNIDFPFEGEGNISDEPIWDEGFRLTAKSPCIDAGTNSPWPSGTSFIDLDGNPRVADGDGNGSEIVDMGPFEFQPPAPVPCPSDVTGDAVVNVNDLLAVINAWGPCIACAADITGDDLVNVNDLLAVINNWGSCQ